MEPRRGENARMKKQPVPVCERCGVEMPRRVLSSGNREGWTKYRRRKHCSWACRYAGPRSRPGGPPCAWCGQPVPAGNTRMCSWACVKQAQVKVPTTQKSGRWQAQHYYPLEACVRCHATTRLHRHHVDGDARNNAWWNIEVICASCHYAEHWIRRYDAKYRADTSKDEAKLF